VTDDSELQAQEGPLQDTVSEAEPQVVRTVAGIITAVGLGALVWILAWRLVSLFF
jgi:hypothetical protein